MQKIQKMMSLLETCNRLTLKGAGTSASNTSNWQALAAER